jgi:hypothetical protein
MRRFVATTFGDGALIIAAASVIIGLVLVGLMGWSTSWLWLCLPIIVLIS